MRTSLNLDQNKLISASVSAVSFILPTDFSERWKSNNVTFSIFKFPSKRLGFKDDEDVFEEITRAFKVCNERKG